MKITFNKIKLFALLIVVAFVAGSCSRGHKQAKHKVDPERVYVCTGPHAKRYHAVEDCKGLSKCSGSVIALTLEEAEDAGLTPCRKCVDDAE